MKSTGYFVLGFAVACVLGLIGLAMLNGELFRTFSSFTGH